MRNGQRAARGTLVVHLELDPDRRDAPRAGFIVSKAVGVAVVRNRVKRRLRHLARARVDSLPVGSRIVIRALPRSASASSAELASDLDRSLERVMERISLDPAPGGPVAGSTGDHSPDEPR